MKYSPEGHPKLRRSSCKLPTRWSAKQRFSTNRDTFAACLVPRTRLRLSKHVVTLPSSSCKRLYSVDIRKAICFSCLLSIALARARVEPSLHNQELYHVGACTMFGDPPYLCMDRTGPDPNVSFLQRSLILIISPSWLCLTHTHICLSAAYEMGPTTGNGAAKMMPITTNNNYHSPSNSQHHLVPVPTAAGGPGTASGFAPQSSGGNGGGLGPGQANGFVPQNQSNSGGMGAAFGSLQSASGNGGMGGSSFGGQSINGNGGGQNGLGNGFPQNQLAVLERQGGASGFNGQNPLLTEGPAFGSGAQNSGGNNGGSLGPALGGFGQLSTVGSGNGPASRATSGGGGAVGPPAPPSLLPGELQTCRLVPRNDTASSACWFSHELLQQTHPVNCFGKPNH